MGIIIGTGEWDDTRHESYRLSEILNSKGIKHWLDDGKWRGHDWNYCLLEISTCGQSTSWKLVCRISQGWLTSYEKNRNPFWPGAQFPASVCRAGQPEDRR
jgi:hypothetical protein